MREHLWVVLRMNVFYCWILPSFQVTTFRHVSLTFWNVNCSFLKSWRGMMLPNCARLLLTSVKKSLSAQSRDNVLRRVVWCQSRNMTLAHSCRICGQRALGVDEFAGSLELITQAASTFLMGCQCVWHGFLLLQLFDAKSGQNSLCKPPTQISEKFITTLLIVLIPCLNLYRLSGRNF